jgi:hypothetical protein
MTVIGKTNWLVALLTFSVALSIFCVAVAA